MSANQGTGRVYRSTIQVELGSTRGKRDPNGNASKLGLKEVEAKLDIGNRRLPSPDIKKVEKDRAPEFVIKPRRQFIDEGQDAKFKVSFDGSPSTKLTWTKDGKTLYCSSKYKIYEQSGYHFLEVLNVASEDSGLYVGTITNSAGTDTASAEIDVFAKPKLLTRNIPPPAVLSPLHDHEVTIGDHDIKLECKVENGDSCDVSWFHNGKELHPGHHYSCRYNGTVASLIIVEIGEEDFGFYECVISNVSGEARTRCSLIAAPVEKFEAPVFIKELHDMEVEDGDKVELVVEVKGTPPIEVLWTHNNCKVTLDTPGYNLHVTDGTHFLIIQQAKSAHSGEYLCEAYNEYGDTDSFCILNVKEVENTQPPEFLSRPKMLTIEEGAKACFTCSIHGYPLPTVRWERNGCILFNNNKYKISSEGNSHCLEILKSEKSDAGQYYCFAVNPAGSVSHTCSLVISNNKLEKSRVTDCSQVISNNKLEKSRVNDSSLVISNKPEKSQVTDFQMLLKSRPYLGQADQQSSTESEHSDNETQNFHKRHSVPNSSRPFFSINTDIRAIAASSAKTTNSKSSPNVISSVLKQKVDLFETVSHINGASNTKRHSLTSNDKEHLSHFQETKKLIWLDSPAQSVKHSLSSGIEFRSVLSNNQKKRETNSALCRPQTSTTKRTSKESWSKQHSEQVFNKQYIANLGTFTVPKSDLQNVLNKQKSGDGGKHLFNSKLKSVNLCKEKVSKVTLLSREFPESKSSIQSKEFLNSRSGPESKDLQSFKVKEDFRTVLAKMKGGVKEQTPKLALCNKKKDSFEKSFVSSETSIVKTESKSVYNLKSLFEPSLKDSGNMQSLVINCEQSKDKTHKKESSHTSGSNHTSKSEFQIKAERQTGGLLVPTGKQFVLPQFQTTPDILHGATVLEMHPPHTLLAPSTVKCTPGLSLVDVHNQGVVACEEALKNDHTVQQDNLKPLDVSPITGDCEMPDVLSAVENLKRRRADKLKEEHFKLSNTDLKRTILEDHNASSVMQVPGQSHQEKILEEKSTMQNMKTSNVPVVLSARRQKRLAQLTKEENITPLDISPQRNDSEVLIELPATEEVRKRPPEQEKIENVTPLDAFPQTHDSVPTEGLRRRPADPEKNGNITLLNTYSKTCTSEVPITLTTGEVEKKIPSEKKEEETVPPLSISSKNIHSEVHTLLPSRDAGKKIPLDLKIEETVPPLNIPFKTSNSEVQALLSSKDSGKKIQHEHKIKENVTTLATFSKTNDSDVHVVSSARENFGKRSQEPTKDNITPLDIASLTNDSEIADALAARKALRKKRLTEIAKEASVYPLYSSTKSLEKHGAILPSDAPKKRSLEREKEVKTLPSNISPSTKGPEAPDILKREAMDDCVSEQLKGENTSLLDSSIYDSEDYDLMGFREALRKRRAEKVKEKKIILQDTEMNSNSEEYETLLNTSKQRERNSEKLNEKEIQDIPFSNSEETNRSALRERRKAKVKQENLAPLSTYPINNDSEEHELFSETLRKRRAEKVKQEITTQSEVTNDSEETNMLLNKNVLREKQDEQMKEEKITPQEISSNDLEQGALLNRDALSKMDVKPEIKRPLDVSTSTSDLQEADMLINRDILRKRRAAKLKEECLKMTDVPPKTTDSEIPEVLSPREALRRRRAERMREENVGGHRKRNEGQAPSIRQRLEDQHVRYGSQAIFQCLVSGIPEPTIQWSVNQKIIKPSKFFKLSYLENLAQLVVAEAFSEDEGEYTCTAVNDAGTDSCSCYLTVEESSSQSSRSEGRAFEGPVTKPPRILSITPVEVTVRCGQPLALRMTFSGEPAPCVKWFQAKAELTSDGHFKIVNNQTTSTLSIDAVKPEDAGRYTITINNDLGSDLTSAVIKVEDVPNPPVGKPHVYDISKQSMAISWCGPPHDGGSPVTHYSVECKDIHKGEWTTLTSTCQSTSYHALNLTPECSYQFRVSASNKIGQSNPSEVSDPIFLTDPMQNSTDYESDGPCEVFSPTLEYRGRDSLPFEPKEVLISPGRRFEDFYELLQEVGKGKFGNVYKCRQKTTGSIWAAKVVKCREKEKDVVRQEINIMNRLAHPKLLMLWDAFEAPRTMVLVMEYVGAGELFERIIREDFVLTECDCVHFMRQICSGVCYMHSQSILHLDLKPENVLCVAENTNQIKIIDFGLARVYNPEESIRILNGTPEFIAPEVINYDDISFATDLWSIGVICYILLSGLSPFLGDNDAETLANVTSGEYDFDDESFREISENAKDFIQHLLIKRKEKRITIGQCLEHPWLAQDDTRIRTKRLNTERLKCFMARRKWQQTGNALLALGRMASLQKISSNSSWPSASDFPSEESKKEILYGSAISKVPDTPLVKIIPKHLFSPAKVDSEGSQLTTNLSNQGKTALSDREQDKSSVAVPGTILTTNCKRDDVLRIDDPIPALFHRQELGCACPSSLNDRANDSLSSSFYGKDHNAAALSLLQRKAWKMKDDPLPEAVTMKFKHNDIDSSTPSCVGPANIPPENAGDVFQQTQSSVRPSSLTLTQHSHPLSHHSDPPCKNAEKILAPLFLKKMVDCTALSGDVVRFDVIVIGNPYPKLIWMFEDDLVKEDSRHIFELSNEQCSLIVHNVTEEDEGEYSCKAVNKFGETVCSADLTVCGARAF